MTVHPMAADGRSRCQNEKKAKPWKRSLSLLRPSPSLSRTTNWKSWSLPLPLHFPRVAMTEPTISAPALKPLETMARSLEPDPVALPSIALPPTNAHIFCHRR